MKESKMNPKPAQINRQKFNHCSEAIGNLTNFGQNETCLLLETLTENVEVSVYSAHTIRIRIYKKEESKIDFSYSVVAEPQKNAYRLEENDNEIILFTASLQLRITKSPVRFSFYTSDGKLINADDTAFGTSWMGTGVSTYKVLHDEEKFMGLGEKTGPLNRRGRAYVNWNTDHFAYPVDADPIYMSTPFYIGIKDKSLAYGIFLDNTHKTTFNFGASNNRFAYFQAEGGEMNYYFMHHDSVENIVKEYCKLTGTMRMPPLWSLGFQQCRYSYYPDKEVLRIAKTFREKEIPADVIYLDIHYMDAYKVFTWHPERFPNPAQLAEELKQMGFRLAVILDPGIKTEKNYPPYEQGLEQDFFVKYPDGTPYAGQVWPGWSHFPDFTKPETRSWWANALADLSDKGVEGFWNDMNEPAAWGQHLPDLVEFDFDGEGATHKKARNIYGFLMARSTAEGATKSLKGKRPFVLTRAGFSGIQRYAAVWTGDNVASDEHMMAGIRLVNSLGLSGVAFAGYDVGGFAGEASPELMAKWIAVGAFSPFFRAHSMINSRNAEPWSFGEETEAIAKNYLKLRYRLMPYLYAMFFEAHQSGIPVARSLALNYAFDENIYRDTFQNQYLFGASFLVIPTESNKELAKAYLPDGKWFDFYTDQLCEGSREVIVESPKEKLPLFVKAGSIIPMQSEIFSLSQKPETTLQIHVYGEANGSLVYYEDQGENYDYEHGAFCKRLISLNSESKKMTFSSIEGSYKSHFAQLKIYFHGFPELNEVMLEKKVLPIEKVSLRQIEPPLDFDPFNPITGSALSIENLPCVEIPHANHEFILSWK